MPDSLLAPAAIAICITIVGFLGYIARAIQRRFRPETAAAIGAFAVIAYLALSLAVNLATVGGGPASDRECIGPPSEGC
jgi:hypothetical protein